MNMIGRLSVLAALVVCSTATRASTNLSPGTEGSLLETITLYPLTIGVDYDQRTRGVDMTGPLGREGEFSADSLTAVIGIRVLPWLAPFVTVGSTETELAGFGTDDDELIWSIGVQASLWQQDLAHPEWVAGRLSVRTVAEYVSGDLSSKPDVRGDWTELNLSLLLGYEVFVKEPHSRESTPYSLQLYAGPGWSDLDGDARISGVGVDFDSSQEFVLVAGADLFVADNVSVGGAVRLGSDTDWRVGLRFHF